MAQWKHGQLERIASGDDLHVAPLRDDGQTFGTPTWIWSVRVGDELFVRAYSGVTSRWYQAAINQHAGRITAAGLTKDVRFEPVAGPINARVDAAYRDKYARSPYLAPMISQRAREATVKIVPTDCGR